MTPGSRKIVPLTVRGREEREDVRDEVPLLLLELVVPVVEVARQVDLLHRPERRLGLLVHLPDVVVSEDRGSMLMKELLTFLC